MITREDHSDRTERLRTGTTVVTGGAGFVGSALVTRLAQLGRNVAVVDSFDDYYDPKIKRDRIEQIRQHGAGRIDVIEADVRDRTAMAEIIRTYAPVSIVHLAARTGVRDSLTSPADYWSVNVEGLQILLDLLVERPNVRFLLAGSSSVYSPEAPLPFSEESRTDPQTPYGRSKLRSEELVRERVEAAGIDASIVRFFTIYGPSGRPDMAIPRFVAAALDSLPVPLFGSREVLRDYTWIDDALSGLLLVEANGGKGGTYNIGSGRTVSTRYLLELIERMTERAVPLIEHPRSSSELAATCADITSIRSLGFEPNCSIEEGIEAVVTEEVRKRIRDSGAEFGTEWWNQSNTTTSAEL